METILGFDFGTQGAKGTLISCDGAAIGVEKVSYPPRFFSRGNIEQSPKAYWEALRTICLRLRSKYEADYKEICAIGLSGQMHSVIPMDRADRPIGNTLTWMDYRSAEECKAYGDLFRTYGCINPILPVYSCPKILWIRENEPERFQMSKRFVFVKDYVKHLLCGEWMTDYSDASATLLYDFENNTWNEPFCKALGIEPGVFPGIADSATVTGHLLNAQARILSLRAGIPIVNGAGDLAAGIVGNGAMDPSEILMMLSTSGQILSRQDSVSKDVREGTHYFRFLDRSSGFLLSSIPAAGLCYSWLNALIYGGAANGFRKLDRAAERSGPDGPLFCADLNGSGTPDCDPADSGAFLGLRMTHGVGGCAHAVLEGVAFKMFEAAESIGAQSKIIKLSGGGSKSDYWCQMFADVFRLEMRKVAVGDGSSSGAACIAAKAIGAQTQTAISWRSFQPDATHSQLYQKRHDILKQYCCSSKTANNATYALEQEIRKELEMK